jgi:hypothetical protein
VSKIPAFRMRVEIEGADAAIEDLVGIAMRAKDARPVLRVIQEMMRVSAMSNFADEGETFGLHWLKDRDTTVQQKLAAGYQDRTEVMEGNLFQALTQRAGGGEAIRRLSAKSTTFGTRLFYAQFQGKKRQLLAITEAAADHYAERMVKYLVGEPT